MKCKLLVIVCGTLFVSVINSTWRSHAAAGDLADVAVLANDSAIQSIHSYYSKIEMGFNIKQGKPTLSRTALYWRTPEMVRLVLNPGQSNVVNLLYSQDRIEVVTKNPNGMKTELAGLRIEPKHQRMTELDAWELCLFRLPVSRITDPPVTPYTVKEAYQRGTVQEEKWVELEGRRLLFLHLVLDRSETKARSYKVWLDPARNWLAIRCEHSIKIEATSQPDVSEHTVKDFVEVAPSILVPTESTTTAFDASHGPITETAKLSDIRVNQVLADVPRMPMPAAGALVFDKVSGTTYQVDQYKRKVGKSYRIGAPAVVAVPAAKPPQTGMWSGFKIAASLLICTGAFLLAFMSLKWYQHSNSKGGS